MTILEAIKAECEKHNLKNSIGCSDCKMRNIYGNCMITFNPSSWDIEEIEKRLSCDQLTTNLRLKCTLDCSNCTDKPKCDRRDDGQTET